MGKNRGFQKQGMINPIAASREMSKRHDIGPSFRDKIEERQKSGMTFEDLKQIALRQEQTGGSEALAKWENLNYKDQLQTDRDAKLSQHEKKEIKELKKTATTKLSHSKYQLLDDGCDERKRKYVQTRWNERSNSESSDIKKKKKRRKEAANCKNHPHRLSSYFKMNSD
eukprot:GHVL01004773.1.p1 GENE.GHVL01004773.1~~GHVL01004773.1.p1  ORF type:complete len:169 (+),score=29.98 GHVL01004773.1:158-664(+)